MHFLKVSYHLSRSLCVVPSLTFKTSIFQAFPIFRHYSKKLHDVIQQTSENKVKICQGLLF